MDNSVFAESYQLIVDENSFEIIYSIQGNVLAMAIDKELTSLLVGIENISEDSIFSIEFPHEVISAENNQFVVLVNGVESDYAISTTDLGAKLTIPTPAFSEEIEIIGTHVIPEFSISVLIILFLLVTVSIFVSKSRFKIFR